MNGISYGAVAFAVALAVAGFAKAANTNSGSSNASYEHTQTVVTQTAPAPGDAATRQSSAYHHRIYTKSSLGNDAGAANPGTTGGVMLPKDSSMGVSTGGSSSNGGDTAY